MSQRRSAATINNQLDLRIVFRRDSTGSLYDPATVHKVEILDSDCLTVLETILAITNLSVGRYKVITSSTWNTASKLIYDKWYYREIAGGTEYTAINGCFIFESSVPTATYSTITQLRNNIRLITASVMSDTEVTTRIEMADDILETDLSKLVDFSLLPSPVPDYINLLSQYKTCELSLAYAYSAKRLKDSFSDIEYWRDMYKILLDKILAGEIDLGVAGLGTLEFDNTHRVDIRPALGHGEYGEFANDDSIKSFRNEYGGDDEL